MQTEQVVGLRILHITSQQNSSFSNLVFVVLVFISILVCLGWFLSLCHIHLSDSLHLFLLSSLCVCYI